ncbi:trypsin-like peptidase domain-containing protein [Piscinibacter sp. HJYY11]|nr:trypsin-like peptidase domain-containing protein [Piscinibacter sp. HJYY11]
MVPQVSLAQAREFPDFADLAERVGPAVVNIRISERGSDGARPVPRRRAPVLQGSDESSRGEGSGFIISGDGYLLTSAHVVEGASEVYVTLTDKREFRARVIGADERSDVAVLKFEAVGLPALRIGDASRLRVGEWVMAIGSPFGLENTVTIGIVSAKQRDTGAEVPFIQADVAVNPGNAGGPLINIRGEAVGINSQILSPAGTSVGISLAIPIDEAMRIADQLRANGRVVRGYIGLLPADAPRDAADEHGKGRAKGALVRQIVPAGPAEKVGIQPGDLVLAVNGKSIECAMDLRRYVSTLRPGSTATAQVSRRGKLLEFKPILTELNAPQSASPDRQESEGSVASVAAKTWGFTVANLADVDRIASRASGVRVATVTAGAEAAGLRQGDVILAVGSTDVADLKQFEASIAKLDRTRPLPITVLRGAWAQFVRLPVVR